MPQQAGASDIPEQRKLDAGHVHFHQRPKPNHSQQLDEQQPRLDRQDNVGHCQKKARLPLRINSAHMCLFGRGETKPRVNFHKNW
jgi:hypothetical protein